MFTEHLNKGTLAPVWELPTPLAQERQVGQGEQRPAGRLLGGQSLGTAHSPHQCSPRTGVPRLVSRYYVKPPERSRGKTGAV